MAGNPQREAKKKKRARAREAEAGNSCRPKAAIAKRYCLPQIALSLTDG
ncbi:MAG: hypothetical protein KME25_12645 [Symplocastrum torsivum CPER-KK1]|uniref:Uncharacterized protein n=1 Tax=Symplocastrum torsivum CPER-KK1 TaxID=450513 RepID=A0A951U9Z2_9CYAN|nr:hypothetical protein [Symplocastrum torsivum CPER-KK1]